MKIEAHDLDSLRGLVRKLQKENDNLKELLQKAGVSLVETDVFEESGTDESCYDQDQGGRIQLRYIDDELARRYYAMFWGRTDVYAKRGAKGGYYPQCENRWTEICPKQRGEKTVCAKCEYVAWTKLTLKNIREHLLGYRDNGTDVIGIYPLFPDRTCRLLVFDFDNHEKGEEKSDYANHNADWCNEVDALRKICELNGIKPLVERSRSGRGAHIWIFFKKPVSAEKVRQFGNLLLDRGASLINLKTFHYYDRMYPAQSCSDGLGNLIALPLQGKALRNGNSAFVDEFWNAYPDQWDVLLNHIPKLSEEEVDDFVEKWSTETSVYPSVWGNSFCLSERPRPWRRKDGFSREDVVGKLHIILGNGIYIDALNLMPRLQNQIRCLAAFDNPEYYKNKRLGYSNYYNFSTVYLGKDVDGYIRIPRGLRETIIEECKKANISYEITDNREKGRPIRVQFSGDLYLQQNLAAQNMLSFDDGVLNAATAFGKTVVCSYIIAQRKVNTLILLQNKELLSQWIDELNKFLMIDEDLPEYMTKSGRIKKRNSLIGTFSGNKKALTGIVDVATVGALYSRGNINEAISSYGMVILDECHHAASMTCIELLQTISAKYVYGVSATPKRSDNMERVIFLLLGPVRYKYTALEKAYEQGMKRYVIPRYTPVIENGNSRTDINEAYMQICSNKFRNEMIIADVNECLSKGRTPLILTKYKDHAKLLYDELAKKFQHVFILYGGNSDKENSEIRLKLKEVHEDEPVILIATGQKIGEGFDYPRLDTLLLVAPVSFEGRLEQYIGRLNRDYEGKTAVFVYDYIDSHIRFFNRMYAKRLRTYKRTGYKVCIDEAKNKHEANSIFDYESYTAVFERDLAEAKGKIIISSPEIIKEKINRLIALLKSKQESGGCITVVTQSAENYRYQSPAYIEYLFEKMRFAGFEVIVSDDVNEHFAVIDDEIVWHGSMNLLGKEEISDNLIRINDYKVASELLEIAIAGKQKIPG